MSRVAVGTGPRFHRADALGRARFKAPLNEPADLLANAGMLIDCAGADLSKCLMIETDHELPMMGTTRINYADCWHVLLCVRHADAVAHAQAPPLERMGTAAR